MRLKVSLKSQLDELRLAQENMFLQLHKDLGSQTEKMEAAFEHQDEKLMKQLEHKLKKHSEQMQRKYDEQPACWLEAFVDKVRNK